MDNMFRDRSVWSGNVYVHTYVSCNFSKCMNGFALWSMCDRPFISILLWFGWRLGSASIEEFTVFYLTCLHHPTILRTTKAFSSWVRWLGRLVLGQNNLSAFWSRTFLNPNILFVGPFSFVFPVYFPSHVSWKIFSSSCKRKSSKTS